MNWTERSANCRLRNWLLGLVILLQIWLPSTLFAAPLLLRCEISQDGETRILDFTPGSDPYGVEATDINGKFRFKAIIIGNEEDIESIKIYTYYREQHQVVLLHEARYMPPFEPDESSFAALTGVNYLYSPSLEQELQYGCALLEAPEAPLEAPLETSPEVHP
ncbi:hypothetical protein SAMN05216420_101225 [Nitrosospira sp. Nl5]|uniref:hypothetical protein n=1 Tax=Nitrosospira sp. Nl5 TaxID=200120 RepID=UPI00088FB9A5|nr:hypothetical protein [Nitrosospira sp. Nl5]SCX88727.1 hypothetical protein SAMN05216420_101225 [Nitrosospira sp. Nl5]